LLSELPCKNAHVLHNFGSYTIQHWLCWF